MIFEMSDRAREYHQRLTTFMDEHVYPIEEEFYRQVADGDRWQVPEVMEELKAKAREADLWNLFLPDSSRGAGLSNLEYAPLCEIMGRVIFASEIFNCSAPVSDLNSAVTGDSISWYDSDTSLTALDSTDILLDGDDYYATQTSVSGCESTLRAQVDVIVNDAATPTLVSEGNEFCISDTPTLFELTLNILEYDSSTNNIAWYDSETGGSVLSSTTLLEHETIYYATLFDPITGCESGFRLPVSADLTACGALTFPDGFSPNGDGVNDRYEVENLAFLYPNFVLEIYNRYGNLVYQGRTGTQLFDGTSNQKRLVTKGDLPVGVYFYIINFNDGSKSKQGRLYLSR